MSFFFKSKRICVEDICKIFDTTPFTSYQILDDLAPLSSNTLVSVKYSKEGYYLKIQGDLDFNGIMDELKLEKEEDQNDVKHKNDQRKEKQLKKRKKQGKRKNVPPKEKDVKFKDINL